MTYGSVSKLWDGGTCAVLASGPSLTMPDVLACRGRMPVIAVKDAMQLAPWADVLYFCGSDAGIWWRHFEASIRQFGGLKYTLDPKASHLATVLKAGPPIGLSTDPTTLTTGRNSGFQALVLATLLGAKRILLLGFDMQKSNKHTYFFGEHPYQHVPPPWDTFRQCFGSLVKPLKAAGVEVINCTPGSALDCFPKFALADVLREVAA